MKQFWRVLAGCFFIGWLASCESDFDKDYKDYRTTLTEKQQMLEDFRDNKRDSNFPYYNLYVNNEQIGRVDNFRIANGVVYLDHWIFDLADFAGCDYAPDNGYSLYFWK